jgi:hypothetical protein
MNLMNDLDAPNLRQPPSTRNALTIAANVSFFAAMRHENGIITKEHTGGLVCVERPQSVVERLCR